MRLPTRLDPMLALVTAAAVRAHGPPLCEKMRLVRIFCDDGIASAVAVSRWPTTRPQKDARPSRFAECVVLVVELSNSDEEFVAHDQCADWGIDLDRHPHVRTSELPSAKWTEIPTPPPGACGGRLTATVGLSRPL